MSRAEAQAQADVFTAGQLVLAGAAVERLRLLVSQEARERELLSITQRDRGLIPAIAHVLHFQLPPRSSITVDWLGRLASEVGRRPSDETPTEA